MPTYAWRGRNARGDEVSGEMQAVATDEALAKLRQLQIAVASIVELTPGVTASTGESVMTRDVGLMARIVFAIVLLVGAGLMLGITTLTRIRCARPARDRVGCTVSSGLLGAWPIPEDTLMNVTGVTGERNDSETTGTSGSQGGTTSSSSQRGTTYTSSQRITLQGDGRTISTEWIMSPIGRSSATTEQRIKAYLATPSDAELTAWQIGFGVLVSFVMAAASLLFVVSAIRRQMRRRAA